MKFPRTPHLPFSLGAADDDKRLSSVAHLRGRVVVITEKLDGENISLHSTHLHARSEDSANQPWRSHIKQLHARLACDIHPDLQIVGEYMYAQHSIPYDQLTSWFYVFCIIDKHAETVLRWNEIVEWCQLLNLQHAPVLYKGPYNPELCHESLPNSSTFGNTIEGYVVRMAEAFPADGYAENTAKWVRADHVQTDLHWTHTWKPNKLLTRG